MVGEWGKEKYRVKREKKRKVRRGLGDERRGREEEDGRNERKVCRGEEKEEGQWKRMKKLSNGEGKYILRKEGNKIEEWRGKDEKKKDARGFDRRKRERIRNRRELNHRGRKVQKQEKMTYDNKGDM